MILYGSSISDGNAHTHVNLPLVLIGGAAGQMKGGRHISLPEGDAHEQPAAHDAR